MAEPAASGDRRGPVGRRAAGSAGFGRGGRVGIGPGGGVPWTSGGAGRPFGAPPFGAAPFGATPFGATAFGATAFGASAFGERRGGRRWTSVSWNPEGSRGADSSADSGSMTARRRRPPSRTAPISRISGGGWTSSRSGDRPGGRPSIGRGPRRGSAARWGCGSAARRRASGRSADSGGGVGWRRRGSAPGSGHGCSSGVGGSARRRLPPGGSGIGRCRTANSPESKESGKAGGAGGTNPPGSASCPGSLHDPLVSPSAGARLPLVSGGMNPPGSTKPAASAAASASLRRRRPPIRVAAPAPDAPSSGTSGGR